MWVVEEAIAAAPEGARNRSTSSIGNNFFKSQLRRHGAHLEQSDVAFGRHLSVSLPELPKKTSSEPTQNTRSASPSPHLSTSLPNLTKYDSSGGCGQSIASPGRIRNKSFAQRALALTPSVIKRQKRRAGVNALNNFGQASISRGKRPVKLLSHQKISKMRVSSIYPAGAAVVGRLSSKENAELIGPVKNLIEDVLPTEDEELTSQSNRLRDKIINLPMIVCYGSDNIVLMETKAVASVLRRKQLEQDGMQPSREVSPVELEKLPIPSHWPGEPEWLKGREEKAENAIVVNDSGKEGIEAQEEFLTTPRSRKSFKTSRFAEYSRQTSAKERELKFMTRGMSGMQEGDKLSLSAAARNRATRLSRWETPKNLLSAVLTDEADVASEDTEDGQGLSSGVRSSSLLLRMGSRRVSLKIGGLGASENGEHGAGRRESVLEEEDGQVREERWQKELEVFQDLSEQLKLREAEDYNFSGGFGLPSEKYVEQHRFLRHLMSSNPVAFDVEAAVIQEEEYRSEARKASASASEVLQRPGDMHRLHPKFMKQIKDLSATRPALLWPDASRIKSAKRVQRRVDRDGKPKKWSLETSIFLGRYREVGDSTPPKMAQVMAKQLEFDWSIQPPAFYSLLCKGKPVPDPLHPSVKEKLQLAMEAVEPHYDGLCKSFYFFAISNDDMPDNKSCVITFDGFKKLCKRIGVTDLVQLHIEARKESGELPQYLRMERRGPKRQSIGSDPSADVCGADCKEQRHGEEPAEALRWELSREEMQDWADHELAKLFHPDAFAASQDHQVAPETAVGPAGPNKAKQPVRDPASAKIDPSTLEPMDRARWLMVCMILAREKHMKHPTEKAAAAREPIEALKRLLELDILPSLPPEATVDIQKLRSLFYDSEVERVLRRHTDLLKSIYKLYKAKDKCALLNMGHWVDCLNSMHIIGGRLGVSEQDAKLIFVQSWLGATLPREDLLTEPGLTIFDFLEAIARLADMIDLPKKDELPLAYKMEPIVKDSDPGFHMVDFVLQASDRAYRKRRSGSAGITNPSTRPLATKIETLMGYIIGALCRYWELETCSTPELIDHIAAVSATMWKWGKRTEDSFRTNKNLKFLVMESHE